ncbi:MAG TPA: hypothetical protein PKN50_12050 [Spirochaetota bacterium]|nr:hypothetical protein [Spirochaetota bacterium]HPV39629.1 hypothetical protein [Spirochaetota bacterium]
MKRSLCAAALLFISLPILTQCAKSIREVGPADAKKKIMIATLSSEYKDRITQGLEERYRGRSRISLVPIEKLNSVDTKSYDALVVVDALMAWQMFNARTRWFIGGIKDPEEKKKIVLFFTAGKPSPDYSVMGVDCITGASEIKEEAEVIRKISEKIDRILK